ncbi:MAG TPA: glycosyltransferase family 2 protein [Flavobacteriales bacterium]|nr:glycosyltransferase family 2 protein [Flavobacteriales bacterium]
MEERPQPYRRTNEPFRVCIVLPCYNEAGVISGTTQVLLKELDALIAAGLASPDSYLCCVDDGSRDATWEEVSGLSMRDRRVRGIKLSANFGHPNALIAGLFSNRSRADILITMDADLQDDVAVIERMLQEHREGKRVVYGVRLDRKVDSLSKRIAAALFYRVMGSMNKRMIRGHADFRSADAGVIADLERFGEANLYLRGIFPLIGYPSAEVRFIRQQRHAGESKYPFRKLFSLAWEGITSFTTTPLKLVFMAGLFMFLFAFGLGIWILWSAFNDHPIQGWASLALLTVTFSAINTMSIGVIGEYVGKIYKEVKHRPRYIIESTTHGD